MPYALTHKVHKEYLEVHLTIRVTPEVALKEAVDRWSAIADLCRRTDRTRILATMQFEGTYGIEKKFKLVKNAPDLGWDHSFKLAVYVKSEADYQELAFAETAMNNLGFEMQLFLKKRLAKKWLLS